MKGGSLSRNAVFPKALRALLRFRNCFWPVLRREHEPGYWHHLVYLTLRDTCQTQRELQQTASADMDAEGRAKAEARRQKILARQKDRLSAITGVYSDPQEPTSTSDGAQQAPLPAASQEAPPQVVRQTDAVQLQQQEQSDDKRGQQMAAVLSAAATHPQQAQAATQDSSNQNQQQELLRSLLRNHISTAEGDGQSAAATGSSSDPAPPPSQAVAQQLPQQVAFLLKLGPVLSTAVQQTQLMRVMSAVLLAYAVLSGWEVGMRPALLVPLLDVLLVVSAVVVLSSTSYGRRLAAAEAASKDVQLPMRLRSLDVLSLFPGVRELISVFTGYRQFANALSEDVAVYIVGLGLFTVMVNSVAV